MPLPTNIKVALEDVATTRTNISNILTAIDALPDPPLEADLPDIVAIVASLQATSDTLAGAVEDLINLIKTTRLAQS